MTTIKIISNPYEKEIQYARFDDSTKSWIDIREDDPNSVLIGEAYTSCFFPFKVDDIVRTLKTAYATPSSPLQILFEGTEDEYQELETVCENHQISCRRSEMRLKDARKILPAVKNIFSCMEPLISQAITSTKAREQIVREQEKFDDVSKEDIPICVVGNYSSGKSSFINALIGREILPSGDKPLTAKIYEIRCSKDPDTAEIHCQHDGNPIDIFVTAEGYEVISDSEEMLTSEQVQQCFKFYASAPFSEKIFRLLTILNDESIDDYVRLSVPFNPKGILGASRIPYVIFDTPGSNVRNHEKHIEVLKTALHGMSNGLMLYVATNDQLDTISNQQLCEQIKGIPEIDTRFTMLIVNKADCANLTASEEEREYLRSTTIPNELNPEGIYFVSSLIGLGYKIDAAFIDRFGMSAKIYQFSNMHTPDGPFYQQLYRYTIAPPQIEASTKAECQQIVDQCAEKRVYVNCGFYWVEQEIEKFARQYAAYNKCYQSWNFLQAADKVLEWDLQSTIETLQNAKNDYEEKIRQDSEQLTSQLYTLNTCMVENDIAWYANAMKNTIADASVPLTPAQLEMLESDFTDARKAVMDYDSHTDATAEALQRIKSTNIFNKDERQDLARRMEVFRETAAEKKKLERTIDTFVADQLLEKVKELFQEHMVQAQEMLFRKSVDYWEEKTGELRDAFLKLVTGSKDITPEQQAELQEVIEQFAFISFEGQVDQIFLKEIFERQSLVLGSITLFENHRLNKNRLSKTYNRAMQDGVMDIFTRMKESHRTKFETWQQALLAAIEEKLTDLNPQLSKNKALAAHFREQIETKEMLREQIQDYTKRIRELINWEIVTEE